MNQPRGGRWVGAKTLILSLTERWLCEGSMMGSGAPRSAMTLSFVAGGGAPVPFGQLGVRVHDAGQIGGARAGVEVLQQAVVQRRVAQAEDPALGVVDVPEGNGLCRAGPRARRDHLAVADAAVLVLRLDARRVDPLHAVGALLHHA